jgi:hypothetical protein
MLLIRFWAGREENESERYKSFIFLRRGFLDAGQRDAGSPPKFCLGWPWRRFGWNFSRPWRLPAHACNAAGFCFNRERAKSPRTTCAGDNQTRKNSKNKRARPTPLGAAGSAL